MKRWLATGLALLIAFAHLAGLPANHSLMPVEAVAAAGSRQNPFAELDEQRKAGGSRLTAPSGQGGLTAKGKPDPAGPEANGNQRYLVRFRPDCPFETMAAALAGENYKLVGFSENRLVRLRTRDLDAFRRKADGLLADVEAERTIKADRTVNDPMASGAQWALNRLNLGQAWDITTGSYDVFVAVLDTGVDSSHPELDDADIRQGWDYLAGGAVINDNSFHGTAVTGIIAAETNNGIGIAGVCWNVAIVPLQILDAAGSGTSGDLVEAIYDAADAGIKVINMSLGSTDHSWAEYNAVQYAVSKGCIPVASAGNSGTTAYNYPASYENVISVGSINSSNIRSTFSNHNDYVDFYAPGEAITTLAPTSRYASGYIQGSGTSFAAPYVSGIAALAAVIDPRIGSAGFKDRASITAQNLGPTGWDPEYQNGLVDAGALLASLSIKSDNAWLISLDTDVGWISPAFTVEGTHYDLAVPGASSQVRLSAYPQAQKSRVLMDGVEGTVQSITLPPQGQTRTVTVRTIAENQTTETVVTIDIYRQYNTFALQVDQPAGTVFNGHLLSIALPETTALQPVGFSATNRATCTLFKDEALTVEAGSSLQLAPGDNWHFLKVVSEDQTMTRVYPYLVHRLADSAVSLPLNLVAQVEASGMILADSAAASGPVIVSAAFGKTPAWSVTCNGAAVPWPVNGRFTGLGSYVVTATDAESENAQAVVRFKIVPDTPEYKVSMFVTRFYELCLGRTPDEGGLGGWVDALLSRRNTGADVGYGFVFSEEFKKRNVSDEAFVTILYKAFFDREPDSGGYAAWLGTLSAGMSRYSVLSGFTNSDEFGKLAQSFSIERGTLNLSRPADLFPDVTAFVTRFYKLCLGRMPDENGIDAWVGNLKSGASTGADVGYGFVFSPEFQMKDVSDSEYVTILYRAFFDREPDAGGYAGWMGVLERGGTRYHVLRGFTNSDEFGQLCQKYLITRGGLD